MYGSSAQILRREGHKAFLKKEREVYIEKFESGEIDPNEVIKEFKSRSLVSRLLANFDDTIRYQAAKQYQARQREII